MADGVGGAPEVIVEVGSAGGSIALLGVRRGEEWFLCRRNDESALADDLAEEDRDLLDRLVSQSEWVRGWEAGLALLDEYPWAQLTPIAVHPEFRDLTLAAIAARARRLRYISLEEWRQVCLPLAVSHQRLAS
jgi:hypothetical protein